MRWELEPFAGGTRLTLWHNIDRGFISMGAAGWHVCLDRLEHAVNGETPPWSIPERWREVHPAYVESLPAEAATIGPPS
jgi:hypothetical protein